MNTEETATAPKHGEFEDQGLHERGGRTKEIRGRTWCDHCREWVQTNGVMGPLKFAAFHQDADCLIEVSALAAE